MRKSFVCKQCKTPLTAVNYKKSVLIVIGIWGFVLSPIIWTLMCCGYPAMITDVIGLVLFMGLVGPSVIELRSQGENL